MMHTFRPTWKHVFLLGIIVGFFHLLFYAVWVPPWQFPDEPRHVEYIRLIHEIGHAPAWSETDPHLEAAIIRSMARYDFWRFGFAIGGYVQHRDQTFAEIWTSAYQNVHFHPPLYYRLMAWLTGDFPLAALESQLFFLRLVSVLIATFSLLIIGLTGWTLGGWRLGVGVLAFAALLPNHIFINASVNNDVLAEFFGVLTVAAGVAVMKRGFRPLPLLLLVGGMALAVLTKRSTVFLLIYVTLSLMVAGWYHHLRGRYGLLYAFLTVLLAAAVLLLGGWLAWRLGRVEILKYGLRTLARPHVLVERLHQVPWTTYAVVMFESFWARTGWLNIILPSPTYPVLALLTLLAFLGWFPLTRDVWRNGGEVRDLYVAIGLVFLLTVLTQWGMVVGKEILHFGAQLRMIPQGRYLYPFLPAYAIFYVGGWRWWLRRLRFPPITVIVTGMGLFALFVIWHTLEFYYGPFGG